jgi:type I restriction enzyme S subunit
MDIEPDHLKIVRQVLDSHLADHSRVWVFGSRAKKAKKKFSDLDIAIDTNQKLTLVTLASLQNAFSESDLPYKVDVIDLNNIDAGFRDSISPDLVLLFEKH